MSDLENEKAAIDKGKGSRKVMSLKKNVAIDSSETTTEVVKKGAVSKPANTVKKPVNQPAKKKSTEEIFSDTFAVKVDKNGDVKPAKVTQADLKSLCSTGNKENLSVETLARVCSDAGLTDSDLGCLTEIVLHVMDLKSSTSQKSIFEVCIRIASGVWINKHHGSMDLYKDIFGGVGDRPDAIRHMEATLKVMFDKRVPSVVEVSVAQSIDTVDSGLKISRSMTSNNRHSNLTKKTLEMQKQNLLVIGVLWLIDKGSVDFETAIDYFSTRVGVQPASKVTFKDVTVYLARQCLVPEPRLTKVVFMLNSKISTLEREKVNIEKSLRQREYQISQLEEDLSVKRQEVEHSLRAAIEAQAGNAHLKKQFENHQLDERATRTHLRDNEGKAKAKAINLLSEEVLEPLRLSLSALQREKPKTEVAAHQIELVLESIKRDLQWFRK